MIKYDFTKFKWLEPYEEVEIYVPHGWLSVMYRYCEAIDKELKEHGVEQMFVTDQLKEKYGELRWYWHWSKLPQDENNRAAEMFLDRIERTIDHLENITGDICCECGTSVDVFCPEGYWVEYVCPDCYQKRQRPKGWN